MAEAADWYTWNDDSLILQIRVQPRAKRDAVSGVQDNRLRIRITAPPVDGKANQHLTAYLAKCFGVPRARVLLLAGATGRDKRFRIDAPAQLPEWLPGGPLS